METKRRGSIKPSDTKKQKRKGSLKSTKLPTRRPSIIPTEAAFEEDPKKLLIKKVLDKTNLTEDQLAEEETKFLEVYPEGKINLEQFAEESQVI